MIDLSPLAHISSGQVALVFLVLQFAAGMYLKARPVVAGQQPTALQVICQFLAVDFQKVLPLLGGGTTPVVPAPAPTPAVPVVPGVPAAPASPLLSVLAKLLEARLTFAQHPETKAVADAIAAAIPVVIDVTEAKAKP